MYVPPRLIYNNMHRAAYWHEFGIIAILENKYLVALTLQTVSLIGFNSPKPSDANVRQ